MASHNAELRKARYDLALRLGYSAKEARAMRDRSAETIRANVQTTRNDLESTPVANRPVEVRNRLETLREWQRGQLRNITESRADITPQRSKEDEWAQWSKRGGEGFPTYLLDEISFYNIDAGEPEFSSYGYRIMYARYVLGYDEADALDFAEYVEDAVI